MDASWADFAAAAGRLAAFGAERLDGQVAYLATVRLDGSARLHPVTPIIGGGLLFVFMELSSPKGQDLRRNGWYALHSAVGDSNGAGGEFSLRGRAALVTDPAQRQSAAASATYAPADRYILFALSVLGAASTVYVDGRPVRARWGEP